MASLAQSRGREKRFGRVFVLPWRHAIVRCRCRGPTRPIGAFRAARRASAARSAGVRRGAVLAPHWFWLPLAVVAAGGRWRPGVPPYDRVLCRLAADRRHHAGDDAGRLIGPAAFQPTIARGEGGASWVSRCSACFASASIRTCSIPASRSWRCSLVGLAHGLHPGSDAGRQPALAARLGGAVRIRVQPPAAGLGAGDHPHHRLDSAAVGGRRRVRSTSPASGPCSSTAAASGWPGWAIRRSSPVSASPRSMPA